MCQERVEVGNFAFHQTHLHYHFEDYARYELRFLDDAENSAELVSIKSKSGHEIVLDDSQGSTLIRVRTAGGRILGVVLIGRRTESTAA